MTKLMEVSNKEVNQELIEFQGTLGGVTYTISGLAAVHVKRNELDNELYSALFDMIEHVENQKPLKKRLSKNKMYGLARTIKEGLTQDYFNDEVTKHCNERWRKKMEQFDLITASKKAESANALTETQPLLQGVM